jgi:hypothetical protein
MSEEPELTKEERDVMTHATAADAKKSKRGFRNHFCVTIGSDHDTLWQGLVKKGVASVGCKINDSTSQYFHVSEQGCKLLELEGQALQRAMGRD